MLACRRSSRPSRLPGSPCPTGSGDPRAPRSARRSAPRPLAGRSRRRDRRRIASPRAEPRRGRRRKRPARRGDLLHLGRARRCSAGRGRSRRRARRCVRSPSAPPSARIDRSSEISTPSKPISPRMTSAITLRDNVAGARRIDRRVDDMGGHRPGHRRPARGTARNRVRASSSRPVSTTRQAWWLSTWARPWPGMCLMTGSTPPASSPSHTARPSRATRAGSLP